MARVVRFPCHDDDTAFVLVNITSTSSHSLDLKLVGTEGAAPYAFNLKHSRVASLKAKDGPYTSDEWETILESIFLVRVLSDGEASLMEGVEAVAQVEENVSISIRIRKRTEGITQRLGAIQLPYDEDQEVQLFEWCGTAVESTNSLARESSILRSKYKDQQETITKLNSQLEDLIAAKATHETELLKKFCDILNEKKSKIRDQQRLLSHAETDKKFATEVRVTREMGKNRQTGTSRLGKRKANNRYEVSTDEEGEPELGVEKMDVDVDQVPNDSDEEAAMTTDKDETAGETTDGDNGEQVPQVMALARSTRQITGDTGKVVAKITPKAKDVSRSTALSTTSKKQEEQVEKFKTPPRRQLPFSKKQAAAVAKPPIMSDNEGSETASEDDEL